MMRNRVDVLDANGFSNKEQNNNANPNRKLLSPINPLPKSEALNVERYLKVFILFFGDMKKMFSDNPEKTNSFSVFTFVAMLVRAFTLLILIRSVLLAFNDHDGIAYYLGHKSENDAWKHITIIIIITSAYTYAVYNLFFNAHGTIQKLTWLEPFQVLNGMKPASDFGLSAEMLHKLLKRSKIVFYPSLFVALFRSIFGLFIFFTMYNYNFNYIDEQEMIGTIWIVLLTCWTYFSSGATFIISAFYDVLCYYFKIRFKKVNADIDYLIDPNNKLDAKDRHALLYNILHEHNHLCEKLNEYNVFWSSYVLYSYVAVPFVCLYTLYQVVFVNHTMQAIIVMSMLAWEAFIIFTKASVSGSKMNYIAHAPYYRLIRATFDEFPIDLRLQLRILIQRLSGPSISFYCSDLFEVSHKTYFNMILGLGQNFFLITDFITVQNLPLNLNDTTPLLDYTTPMIESSNLLLE